MSKLLLMSGGVDSAALAAYCRPSLCLTIDYGQNSAKSEIAAARQICADLELQHETFRVDISPFGLGDMSASSPSTNSQHSEFWPFRNQFLITVGALVANKFNLNTVLIGTVKSDSRHRDGSLEFIEILNSLLQTQEGDISLDAPAIAMTTQQLIRLSGIRMNTLGWTYSCHKSDIACGNCHGCFKHSEVLNEFGFHY